MHVGKFIATFKVGNMNTMEKSSGHLNPIDRDLVIIFATGFLVAITVVVTGIVLLNLI